MLNKCKYCVFCYPNVNAWHCSFKEKNFKGSVFDKKFAGIFCCCFKRRKFY